jgi:hypothetical protein
MSGVGTLRGSIVGLARDGSAGIHDGIVLVVLGSIVAIATAAILDRRVRAPQTMFILILPPLVACAGRVASRSHVGCTASRPVGPYWQFVRRRRRA